jgi:hypothetical protein
MKWMPHIWFSKHIHLILMFHLALHITQVYCTHSTPDYSLPWQKQRQFASTGRYAKSILLILIYIFFNMLPIFQVLPYMWGLVLRRTVLPFYTSRLLIKLGSVPSYLALVGPMWICWLCQMYANCRAESLNT